MHSFYFELSFVTFVGPNNFLVESLGFFKLTVSPFDNMISFTLSDTYSLSLFLCPLSKGRKIGRRWLGCTGGEAERRGKVKEPQLLLLGEAGVNAMDTLGLS